MGFNLGIGFANWALELKFYFLLNLEYKTDKIFLIIEHFIYEVLCV